MGYNTKIKNPETDKWLDVFTGKYIVRYIHIFNTDKNNDANIALAIYDTQLEEINHPQSGGVVQVGTLGSTKYEYFVTARTTRGETDPLVLNPILDGYIALDDNNYHSITWTAVDNIDVVGYNVYVRVNEQSWFMAETDASTTSIENKGNWDIYDAPPWLNTISISCLLTFEKIPANSILTFNTDIELVNGEKLVFATTNGFINLYARAIDATS